MKKILFVLLFTIISILNTQAQDIAKNAVGIRISETVSGDYGFGPEITYQRQILTENNRIDANLSWRSNSVVTTIRGGAYFHWTYNIWDNLNWFAGPGLGAGYINFDTIFDGFVINVDRDDEVFPYIGADFGVDYRFDFPLQVAFSIRPTYDFHDIENGNGLFDDINQVSINVGVAARYTF